MATDYISTNAIAACPFCGGNILPHWIKVNIWRCLSCSLLFRYPFPTDEELFELYNKGWSCPEANRNETGSTDDEIASRYIAKIACELDRTDFKGLKLLEFGAGKGAMMTAFKELGADVYGIEPFGYEYLKDRRLKVYRSLDDVPKNIQFDGILAIQVIEHLIEPWTTIKYFHDILKKDGWLFISTLNVDGLNARIFRSRWREIRKTGHIIFYNSCSLEKILYKAGFIRFKRLHWLIKFNRNPVRASLNFLLQVLLIDGELRYLARK